MTSIRYKISYVILSLIGGMLLLVSMMLLLLKCWKFLTVIISQRQHRNCSWRIFWKLFRCLLVLTTFFISQLLLICQSLATVWLPVFGAHYAILHVCKMYRSSKLDECYLWWAINLRFGCVAECQCSKLMVDGNNRREKVVRVGKLWICKSSTPPILCLEREWISHVRQS